MKKKNMITLICVAIVSFVLGFLCKMFISMDDRLNHSKNNEETSGSIDSSMSLEDESGTDNQVRIREGYVEFYDGKTWQQVGLVTELQAQDPYEVAKEKVAEFESDYLDEIESNNALLVQQDIVIINAPTVGEKKDVSTGGTGGGGYTQNNTTTGTSSAGTSSVPNTPSTPAAPSTSVTPTTPSTPETPASPSTDTGSSGNSGGGDVITTPETPSTEDNSGDGEDIGWSDDYL